MALEQVLEGIIKNGTVLHEFLHGGEDATVTTEGGQIPTIANVAKRASVALSASFNATSNTTAEVVLGVKAFTIAPNKGFQPGQWVTVARGEINMLAQVVSYVGTTLNLNITLVRGTGTFNTWTIALTGPRGAAGTAGKNAYELAREFGFSGTAEDYLESLHGQPGEPGGIGPQGKDNYELAQLAGFEGTLGEYLESLRGPQGNPGPAGGGTGSGGGAPKRHYISSYPWENVVVVPPAPIPVTDVELDAVTLQAYTNAMLNGIQGTKRTTAAQAIINSLGSSPRFVLKRNDLIVLTANYNTPLVLVNTDGEMGLRLGIPASVVSSPADIETGVWVAEILGGSTYTRSIRLSVGPVGSENHLFLDNDLAANSTYETTFIIALPQ